MFSNQGFPNSLPRRSVERFGFTTYMGQGIKINQIWPELSKPITESPVMPGPLMCKGKHIAPDLETDF